MAAAPAITKRVQAEASGDPVEPTGEVGTCAAKQGRPTVEAKEDFEGQVLGLLAIAGQPDQRGIDTRPVVLEQGLEGRRILALPSRRAGRPSDVAGSHGHRRSTPGDATARVWSQLASIVHLSRVLKEEWPVIPAPHVPGPPGRPSTA